LQFETENPATLVRGSRSKPARGAATIHRLGVELEKATQAPVLARVPVRRDTSFLAGSAVCKCGYAMTRDEERELMLELEQLKQEHRDLDSAIDALLTANGHDRIQVQRLKKRKLQLRDRIGAIEDQLFPDIIA